MIPRAFVDTNILVYHLLGNHPEYSPASTWLLHDIALGAKRGYCSSTVIFELAHVLETQANAGRTEMAQNVSALLQMNGLESDHPRALLSALDFWKDQPALSFADCIHLAMTLDLGMDDIYTYDQKMNRYPSVTNPVCKVFGTRSTVALPWAVMNRLPVEVPRGPGDIHCNGLLSDR